MPKVSKSTRSAQPFTSGLGLLFKSPRKRRQKKHAETIVQPIGEAKRHRKLQEKLQCLQQFATTETTPDSSDSEEVPDILVDTPTPTPDHPFESILPDYEIPVAQKPPPSNDAPRAHRRVLPDAAANSLYARWTTVLPRLIVPLLAYISTSTGKIPLRVTNLEAQCRRTRCERKTTQILCLFQDCK